MNWWLRGGGVAMATAGINTVTMATGKQTADVLNILASCQFVCLPESVCYWPRQLIWFRLFVDWLFVETENGAEGSPWRCSASSSGNSAQTENPTQTGYGQSSISESGGATCWQSNRKWICIRNWNNWKWNKKRIRYGSRKCIQKRIREWSRKRKQKWIWERNQTQFWRRNRCWIEKRIWKWIRKWIWRRNQKWIWRRIRKIGRKWVKKWIWRSTWKWYRQWHWKCSQRKRKWSRSRIWRIESEFRKAVHFFNGPCGGWIGGLRILRPEFRGGSHRETRNCLPKDQIQEEEGLRRHQDARQGHRSRELRPPQILPRFQSRSSGGCVGSNQEIHRK